MCWSGEASALIATAGLGTTAYLAKKGEHKVLWVTLGYFSLMELLQAFTYPEIGNCGSHMNHVLTVLGFIHIAFQPFFINALSMYFVPDEWRKKIQPYVYTLCFAATVLMLLKLYPFHLVTGTGQACTVGSAICGEQLCSVLGNFHIAWAIPFSASPHWVVYPLVAFVLPILYGSWRMTVYHIIVGPLFAMMLTDNPNEWPAVWCLLSLGLLLIGIKTPLRKVLHVQKWFFWRFPL